jgi:hypothetical protein
MDLSDTAISKIDINSLLLLIELIFAEGEHFQEKTKKLIDMDDIALIEFFISYSDNTKKIVLKTLGDYNYIFNSGSINIFKFCIEKKLFIHTIYDRIFVDRYEYMADENILYIITERFNRGNSHVDDEPMDFDKLYLMFEFLIEKGVKIITDNTNEISGYSKTPLCFFIESLFLKNNPELQYKIVEIILRYGANPNYAYYEDNSSSCISCSTYNLDLLKLLVKYGGSLDSKADDSRSLLDDNLTSYNKSRFEVVEYLIENGADINEISEEEKIPILYNLLEYGPVCYMDLLLLYLIDKNLIYKPYLLNINKIIDDRIEYTKTNEFNSCYADIQPDPVIPMSFKKYRLIFDDYTNFSSNCVNFSEQMLSTCRTILNNPI